MLKPPRWLNSADSRTRRDGMPIEEIGITAQKRTERLADVPVSASVVSSDVLTKLNFELRTNDAVMRFLTLNLDRELRRKRKMDAKLEAKAAAKAIKRRAADEAAAEED